MQKAADFQADIWRTFQEVVAWFCLSKYFPGKLQLHPNEELRSKGLKLRLLRN